MGKLKTIFFISFLAFLSCEEAATINNYNLCNNCVIINKDLYNNTTTTNYSITDVALNGDLLTVKIAASGCDGNTWKATLVDSGATAESFPLQRFIKIAFENKEDCLAVVGQEFTFNIKELKENEPKITLNLEGWDAQINYN